MIGTQVVSFMKARKIAQDELNKSLAEQATQLATDEQALRKLEDSIKSGAKYEDVFDDAMQGASKSAKEHALATKGAAGSTDVFVEKQKQAQTALKATATESKKTKIAMQALATIKNIAVGMAISWGVSKLVEGIDSLQDTEKELEEMRQEIIDAAETAKSEFDSIKSNIDSTISTADELGKKYAELAQGVRNLGKVNQSQGTLSNDEYQEFLDISNQLSDLFPTLTQSYDENGNAILRLSGNINTITDSLNDYVSAEQALVSMELQSQLRDIGAGYSIEIDDANKTISSIKGNIQELKLVYNGLSEIIDNKTNLDNFMSQYPLLSQMDYEKIMKELMTNSGYTIYDLDKLNDEELTKIKEIVESNYTELTQTYVKEINKANNIIENANKNFANYFLSSLQGDSDYASLEDDYKIIVNGLISNYDFSDKLGSKAKNLINFNEIKNELINSFVNLSNDEEKQFQEYYNKLLSIDTDVALAENLPRIQEYINKLAELLGIESSKLQIALGYNLNEDRQLIQSAKERLGFSTFVNDAETGRHNIEISGFIDSLNEDELTTFMGLEIPEDAFKYTSEELQEWFDKQQKFLEDNPLATHIELQTGADSMKSAFDDLQTALSDYQENGLEGMDISNLTKLGDENTFGNINGSTAAYERFLAVMQDVDATAEEVQNAFDELATAYIYDSELADMVNESNVEWVASQLEKNNVINASAVAEQMLINKIGAEKTAIDECIRANLSLNGTKITAENASELFANASEESVFALYKEANAAGVATQGLTNYIFEKIKQANYSIKTDGDIANLMSLCDALGETGSLMKRLIELKSAYDRYMAADNYNAVADIEKQIAGIETAITAKIGVGTNVNSSAGSSSSSGGSGGSETSEKIDWIEIKITRLEEAISRLDKTVNNTYTNWTNRNTALASEMSKVREEISLQQQAYNRYMQEANNVGLSSNYVDKIKNGELNIETITDEGLINRINSYKEFYEKAIACSDAIQELNINLGELAQQQFDNIQQEYSDLISLIEGSADIIDERINRTEEQGYFISKDYYTKLIDYEKKELSSLNEEYKNLQDSLKKSVNLGYIVKDSEAWNEMNQEILDVEKAIEDSTSALVEYNNAIRDIEWEIFDYLHERIGKITEETEFLIDLLDNDSLYDDIGKLNEKGESVNALHGINYNTYMQQSLDYANELKKIESDIAKDPSNKDLIERREELLKLQREAISNAEAEKDAIKSLVEEGINIHLESLTALIDKYKESLNAAKD